MGSVKDVVPPSTRALGELRAGHPVHRRRRSVLRRGGPARNRLRADPLEQLGAPAIVNAEDIVGLVLAVLVLGYLVYALLAPEKLG